MKKLILIMILNLILFSTNAFAGEMIESLPDDQKIVAYEAINDYISIGVDPIQAEAQVENIIRIQYETQMSMHTYTNRWGIELSEYEKEMIAKLVYLESGNQSDVGKKAVVAVFLNRMVDGRFGGHGVDDVLFAEGQFTTSTRLNSVSKSNWMAQIPIIDQVLNGDPATDNMDYLYFRSDRPRGSNDVKIQDHWFSK